MTMFAAAVSQDNVRPLGQRALQIALNVLTALLMVGCVIATPPAQSSTEVSSNGTPPPGRIGKIGLLSGPVTLTDLQTREQQPASLNWPITSGYRLTAGPLARAEVHIGSVALRLDASTEVDFARIDDELIQVVVLQGSVALRARNRDVLPEIDLVTPRERVVFDDIGRYRIDVDRAPGVTAVTTWMGAARVATGRSTFEVRSGQRGEFSTAPAPGFTLVQPAADTFDDWVAARDRRDDAIASTQYVSPETTGVEVLDQYGTWRTVPEYGSVWYPAAVPYGWAPYRYGRWAYISPWGWTWVDEAPWGFAPFHYGRWAFIGGVWGWVPGAWVARPIYAPALVGWYGAPGVGVTVGYGSVGWFPLAPYEVYIPPYYYNRRYITGVNVSHVGNIDYGRVNPPRHYQHQRPNTSTWVPNDAIIRQEPIKRVVHTPPADTSQFVGRPTPPPVLSDAAKRRVVNVAPTTPGQDVVRPAPRAGVVEGPNARAQPAPGTPGRKIDAPDRPPVTSSPVTPTPASVPGKDVPPTRRPEFVTRPQPAPSAPPQPKSAPQTGIESAPLRKPTAPSPSTAPRPDFPRPAPAPAPQRIEPSPKTGQVAPPPRIAAPSAAPPPMRGPQSDFVMRTPAPPKVDMPRTEPPRAEPPRAEPPRGGKTTREQ
jgi:hypothetical protein